MSSSNMSVDTETITAIMGGAVRLAQCFLQPLGSFSDYRIGG